MSKFYTTYEEASLATRALGIRTITEYRKRRHQDLMLPSNPNTLYRNEWKGYREFFGGNSRYYETLREASTAARALGIATLNEYLARYKEDQRLPRDPKRLYFDEWAGFARFLRGENKDCYESLGEASAASKALGIRTIEEYSIRYSESPELPKAPEIYYKNEWKSWREFLGTKRVFYNTIGEAREAVKRLGIKTIAEYHARYKEDPLLPSKPDVQYSGSWVGCSEFLVSKESGYYETLAEASVAAIALEVCSKREYKRCYRKDPKLPADPQQVYKESWKSFSAFLGMVKQSYATLSEASAAVRRLGITSRQEYIARYKEDALLPLNPAKEYRGEWKGYRNLIARERRVFYKTLSEAVASVRALGIKSITDYRERYKEDESLPSNPAIVFRSEWNGWTEFLGNALYPTLAEAKIAARALRVRTKAEYDHEYRRDPRLPQNPGKIYSSEWKGFDDFLNSERRDFVKYQNISQASEAVKKLGIKDRGDYLDHYLLDDQLPECPEVSYGLEWDGWESFTGHSESIAARYFSNFEAARSAARQLGVSTRLSYLEKIAGDSRFPLSPEKHYKSSWDGWRDYLGVDNVEGKFNSYYKARGVARELGFKSGVEYSANCKALDSRLPVCPDRFYSDDWKGWPDYIGSSREYNFYPLDEAAIVVARLGIRTLDEYKERYREDRRLPSNPHKIYADQWVSYPSFLRGVDDKVAKYGTLEQASEAARALGFTTKSAYLEGYYVDPMLPARPRNFYKDHWPAWGWGKFLGLEKYNYQQAREVARRLGICSSSAYIELRRQDVHLPADPAAYYRQEWKSWTKFLLPSRCCSLADVKYAVKVLKINNSKTYRNVYKSHPCLPANPDRVFSDEWVSWRDLCDMPELYSYEETRALVIKYGVKGGADYKRFYAEMKDPRIPRDPATAYKEKWRSWYSFIDKPEPFKTQNIDAPYKEWASALNEFLGQARGRPTKESCLCRFVRDYVQRYGLGFSPLDLYTSPRVNKNLYFEFLNGVSGGFGKTVYFAVKEFSEYFLKEKLTIEDEETGEVVRIEGANNPFASFSYEGDELSSNAGETNKPALAYQYVSALCNWIVPDAAKGFADLSHLQKFDADWLDVDQAVIDRNDPDCIFKEEFGKTKIWFPGYWMHTFALASVPARGRQLAYNDSGEADDEIPTVIDGKIVWIPNESPLAGLTDSQGFVKKYAGGKIGMHMTSNKTSAKGEGYDVGWMPEKLAIWMIRLRDWQAKYNPIKRAMPWVECTRTDLNNKQLLAKGGNCFLFRGFGEEECGHYSDRLRSRLAAALYHSQPEGLILAECKGAFSSLSTYDTPYSPHSMRVSLITAYVMEFGLPIEMVMKIAGHSTIVMSLYYVKINSEDFREKFAEGEKRALKNKAYAATKMLEQNRIEGIKSELIQNNEGAIQRFAGRVLPGSFLFRDYGFCPFAGTRCHDGGPLIGSTKVREPIGGGYLGFQNCVRCRHFVTGPVFIGGLLALANEITLQATIQMDHIGDLNTHLSETNAALESQEDALHDAEKAGEKFDPSELEYLNMKCRKLQSDIESASKKADLFLCDLQATSRLIKQCQAVLNEQSSKGDSSNLPQLIVQGGHELRVAFEDSSRFHLLSEVCENAEIYESASAELALPMRSQMLDRMLLRNKMSPAMFALDKQQQLVLGNQLTSFLLSRVRSWRKVDALIEGKLMLADLAENEKVEPKDFAAILERSEGLIASDAPRALEGELL